MSHQHWDYAALMHARGFRVTPQRQLILDAICEGEGHPTPDEIYERVRARIAHVDRATVYRNLGFLCEMRLVVAIRIGGQGDYEIANQTPHHHLTFHNCDAAGPWFPVRDGLGRSHTDRGAVVLRNRQPDAAPSPHLP